MKEPKHLAPSAWPWLVARSTADSHWSRADSEIVCTDERVQISTPSSPSPLFNNVRMSVLGPDAADADIAQTIESYRSRGSRLAWVVTPICRPRDLGARLMAHGMKTHGESWGMILKVDHVDRQLPKGVEVVKIDVEAIDDFVDTSGRGWGQDESMRKTFREDVLRAMEVHAKTLSCYVVYDQGVAAGSGFMRLFERCAVLIGSSVVPEHRGRHLYQALLTQRLVDMTRAGRQLACMNAKAETSGPIAAHYGFQNVGSFESYVLPA